MKVLVLSDTHIPQRASFLPNEFYERVDEVDLIIHAGDFTTLPVLRELESFKPTIGVCGNMDDADIWSLLPELRVERLGELRVGIYHGIGSPLGLEKRVKEKFDREGIEVDLIIFGHSHRWFYGEVDGVMLLNPGSATDRVFTAKRSFAILTIEGKNARITGGTLIGDDREFRGVATDSRKVGPGQLFVALKGGRTDGHNFVADAFGRGASGALVERVVPGLEAGVLVENTYGALKDMVRFRRENFGGQVVAVLGAVGVALTVLNTTGEEDVWVLELGTNRRGEIEELSSITLPDHIIYTKLGPEHLQGLGSTHGAVEEEYSALKYSSGFVLVPDDAPHFPGHLHIRTWDLRKTPSPWSPSQNSSEYPYPV